MRFSFAVDVETECQEDRPASRDEIGARLLEAITDADPREIEDNGVICHVNAWDVTSRPRRRRI